MDDLFLQRIHRLMMPLSFLGLKPFKMSQSQTTLNQICFVKILMKKVFYISHSEDIELRAGNDTLIQHQSESHDEIN